MSIDIKYSTAQTSKIIQPGGSFGSSLDILGKKIITNVVIPFARDNLPGLVSNITSNAINAFGKKNKWTRDCANRKKIDFIYFE